MEQRCLLNSFGSIFKNLLAVAGLILVFTSAPRAQSTIGAGVSMAGLSPKVIGVSGQLAIGGEITIDVQNLSSWAGNHNPQNLVLFLNGRPLKGLYPEQVDLSSNKLLFHIRRTPEAKVVWNDLFHEPVLSRPVSLSVGLVDKGAFETVFDNDNQIALTVIPKVAALVSLVLLFGMLILFVYLARTTNIIRSSGEGSEAGLRRPYELGRVQMSFWLFIIAISYLYLWLVTGDLNTIGPSHLALAGISSATALGAGVVERRPTTSRPFLEKGKAKVCSGTHSYQRQQRGTKTRHYQIVINSRHEYQPKTNGPCTDLKAMKSIAVGTGKYVSEESPTPDVQIRKADEVGSQPLDLRREGHTV